MNPRFDMFDIVGEGNATAEAFKAFAEANPGPVTVYINSPGGNAFEGAALLAEVARHGGVTAVGQGVVASAATLPLIGAAQIALHQDCAFMIHDPSGMAFGPADVHRKAANILDQISDIYARAYARASGNSVDRIKAWMRDETWLSADEALALNFCDRIEGDENPAPVAQFDFTRFQNAPEQLVKMARANGWAAAPSKSSKKE